MARFFTVSAKDVTEIKKVIRNAAIGLAVHEAYAFVKNGLNGNGIAHNDQNANHHNELPHQGGFSSFYIDQYGQWMQVDH